MMSTMVAAHAASAAVALVAGSAALTFRKGSLRHRRAGTIFLVAMLAMAISAMPLAYAAGKPLDVLSAMLVCYLVLTSWMTLRPRDRRIGVGLLLLGLVTLFGYLWVEWLAVRSGIRRPGVPPGVGFVFAGIIAMALIGDGRLLTNRSAVASRRLVRHLWRMCFALFMATVSFFLSRAHLFPDAVRASGVLYVLALAPIVLMAFWWIRTRLVVNVRGAGG
ncbi:MAG TPA: hypothetical protein VF190_02720 [Rhodothermales bacterium]